MSYRKLNKELRVSFIYINMVLLVLVFLWMPLRADQNEKVPPKAETTLVNLLGEIGKLENLRDPKCHATATRLENFIYGTKLLPEARFLKVSLQKKMVAFLWEQLTRQLETPLPATDTRPSQLEILKKEIAQLFPYSRKSTGDIEIVRPALVLEKRDFEHYASVAYGLRAILAVQQETLLNKDVKWVALDAESIAAIKEFLDVFTLSVLQVADRQARLKDRYVIDAAILQQAWDEVQHSLGETETVALNLPARKTQKNSAVPSSAGKFFTLSHIIQQKVKSFEAYNNISMPVFLRNLQVYFARHRWPADPVEGKKFRDLFTEAMVAFVHEGWKRAEKLAKQKGQLLIHEAEVEEMWQHYVPFQINEYEDVIFFANLGQEESVTLEAYDCDAFRDSGVHWKYLQYVLEDHGAGLEMEPDPFAAELLVEGVAQYGVLVLRVAGKMTKKKGEAYLSSADLLRALADIKRRAAQSVSAKPLIKGPTKLLSSTTPTPVVKGNTFFTDVTPHSGIQFMHRTSDWLSRLLRSYLEKAADVATLAVPPAFGGSGAAAGDVNGDGYDDVLLLSGSGNQLFLSDGRGGFRDVTKESGLLFLREDGTPAEPRQPLFADFDNDGDQDILITLVNDNHRLYRNDGTGIFTDVSAQSNLGGKNLVAGPAVTFDYDGDGLLDIYIGYFGDYLHGVMPSLSRRNLNGLPNQLFRNTGNLVFQDVTVQSGTGNTGWAQAAAHSDLDLDGFQDIIVGNDFGVNVYYRNRGDGTFEDVAAILGTDKPSFTMNVGIADLNRDGFPDIYISNIVTMVKDEKYVLPDESTPMKFNPKKLARMRVIEANDLFISNGTIAHGEGGKLPRYTLSDAVGRGYSSTGWAWGANFLDFDNDGDDDLYCVNGMNEYSVYGETPYYSNVFEKNREILLKVYEKESNVFFVNQDGKLQNFSKESGTDLLGNSRSTVYLDFDHDGDLDMVLNNFQGPAVVYRNNSEGLHNKFIRLTLVGDPGKGCNRDAIGARIIATKNGQQLAWREIHGGDGYLTMNPKTQLLGTGAETSVDITVYWPNRQKSEFFQVTTGKSYRLKMGENKLEEI